MSEQLKTHSLNLLVKTLVTLGAAMLIYFTLTSFLFKQSTTLDKQESTQEVTQTLNTSTEESTSTPISRDQLAAGLIAMHNTNISIPESLTLSDYENLIASTTLSKEQIASYSGDNPQDIFPAGPGFLMRGGAGLKVYLPYLQVVFDNETQPLVRVYVDSITSKSGKNILDSESPFEKNNFFNKLNFEEILTEKAEKYYKTERALHLKGDQLSIFDDVKQVSGSIVLSLPISVSKYTLSLDQIVTKSTVKAGNTQVSVKDVKDGALYLHIKSASKTVLYVKCFNQNGEVIAASMITSIDPEQGFDKQSILSFNLGDQVDHLEIYAPSEIATKKYKFAI
jgi:hypothetical protein